MSCSVYEDPCAVITPNDTSITRLLSTTTPPVTSQKINSSGTSEGGSESSSLAGSTSDKLNKNTAKCPPISQTLSSVKKKSTLKIDTSIKINKNHKKQDDDNNVQRVKTRNSMTPIKKQTTTTQRDKKNSNDVVKINKFRTRTIPDSLTLSSTSALAKEIDKDLAKRTTTTTSSSSIRSTSSSLSRCSSTISRGRSTTTPSTPSSSIDESRCKSLTIQKTSTRTVKKLLNDTKKQNNIIKLNDKKTTIDTYGTLPRCRNKNLSLKYDDISRKNNNNEKKKCIIYHETSCQTGLTSNDINNILSGNNISYENKPNYNEQEIQTDMNIELYDDLKKLNDDINILKIENDNLKLKLLNTEKMLDNEKLNNKYTRDELKENCKKIIEILGFNNNDDNNLYKLESSHLNDKDKIVESSNNYEINNLNKLCKILEKSLIGQKQLLKYQQLIDNETIELKEFLQFEKIAMNEAMKDMENDLLLKNKKIDKLNNELKLKLNECKYLVRISEQRKQDNISLNIKLNKIDNKLRELLLTQGATVSGVSVALNSLGTRIDDLIQQLIQSYNISEKELEDVIYHNEAYCKSNSSNESSPTTTIINSDNNSTTKNNSFVSAVICAIKNAATQPFLLRQQKKLINNDNKKLLFHELSMNTKVDMLDYETEPWLHGGVLEDVQINDYHSKNMLTSDDSLLHLINNTELINNDDDDDNTSLKNLTHAILNRRKIQDDENDDNCADPDDDNYHYNNEDDDDDNDDEDDYDYSISGSDNNLHDIIGSKSLPTIDYCNAVNLVDQVIDVDNYLTKLLKVLRIIQLDNDTCIKELRDDKKQLESKLDNTDVTDNNQCPNN